jgi:ribosome biogenesis protein ERB1
MRCSLLLVAACCFTAVQALAKKLLGGSGVISCMAVHPGGDHVIVGSEDKRLAW